MKPILFEASETQFLSNGLGRIDALSCVVTEERNGQYELEMEVSIDDAHYNDIKEGRILLVRHDETLDKQPFDIYHISRPLNGIVTVLAHHISYRTAAITIAPFEASGIGLTLTAISNNAIGYNPFTLWTNKDVSTRYAIDVPRTLRSMLAGEEGSLLDVFGTGEYEWDKFNIKLYLHRGTDSGVVIRYGKDLTELTKTTDMSSVWTGVVPYWRGSGSTDTDTEVTVMIDEEYIEASNASSYSYKMLVPLDLSDKFDEVPTKAQLKAAAQAWVQANEVTDIPATIEFSFENLAAYDEYSNVAALQRLKLCDTVTVVYDKLGVRNTAKIIQTQYDVLLEKYISMTVGEVAPNLSTALTGGLKDEIEDIKKTSVKTRSAIEAKIEQVVQEQTDLILGGSGGHVVHRMDGNGKPSEILIMDTDKISTALQVLRINVNGIGFSSTGINGPYTSAWTLDGHFNADFISTGELNAALIKVGALTDANGLNYWNMETGEFRLAATTKVGESGSTRNIGVNFYGVYRTGYINDASSWVPTAAQAPLTVGDMLVTNGTTRICKAITSGVATWEVFSEAAEGNYFIDTYSGCTYRWNGTQWEKVTDYKSADTDAISAFDTALDQQKVFNKLTNNGTVQGITLDSNTGNLYINATYIATGILSDTQGNNSWNLKTGALTMKNGSINIGNGAFKVSTAGKMTATGAEISGKVSSSMFDSTSGYTYTTVVDNGQIFFKKEMNNVETTDGYIKDVGNDGICMARNSQCYFAASSNGLYLIGAQLNVATNSTGLFSTGFTGRIGYTDDNGATQQLEFINGICVGY